MLYISLRHTYLNISWLWVSLYGLFWTYYFLYDFIQNNFGWRNELREWCELLKALKRLRWPRKGNMVNNPQMIIHLKGIVLISSVSFTEKDESGHLWVILFSHWGAREIHSVLLIPFIPSCQLPPSIHPSLLFLPGSTI